MTEWLRICGRAIANLSGPVLLASVTAIAAFAWHVWVVVGGTPRAIQILVNFGMLLGSFFWVVERLAELSHRTALPFGRHRDTPKVRLRPWPWCLLGGLLAYVLLIGSWAFHRHASGADGHEMDRLAFIVVTAFWMAFATGLALFAQFLSLKLTAIAAMDRA